MGLPKRRHSQTRGRKRRTHYKAAAPAVAVCPHCGAPVIPHRVCTTCGQYKGQQIIEAEEA